jgi:hypothetical protein
MYHFVKKDLNTLQSDSLIEFAHNQLKAFPLKYKQDNGMDIVIVFDITQEDVQKCKAYEQNGINSPYACFCVLWKNKDISFKSEWVNSKEEALEIKKNLLSKYSEKIHITIVSTLDKEKQELVLKAEFCQCIKVDENKLSKQIASLIKEERENDECL